jgi:hypothetical protein
MLILSAALWHSYDEKERKQNPTGKHRFFPMERYELKEMWGKSPSAETHFTLCVIG